jgi:hypothetical protein
VSSVPGDNLHTAIQAGKDHYGLRFCDIAYVAYGHEAGFGHPHRIDCFPVPKQRHQDLKVVGTVLCFPDRQFDEVPQCIAIVSKHMLGPCPGYLLVGHRIELITEGVVLIPQWSEL